VQDLLLVTDPDWAKYAAGDPEFLLRTTGDTIRAYCGWHISPSITEVVDKLEVGSRGIVMFRTLYLTDCTEVWVTPEPGHTPYLLDPRSYTWHEEGYIEPVAGASFRATSGYYYEPGPTFLPTGNWGLVSATITHGYECVPNDIKAIAYELAGWASSGSPGQGAPGMVVGGDVKTISSPGFSLTLGGDTSLGMNLNADQKARLAKYKIGGVA
jgi:hypothetical protein